MIPEATPFGLKCAECGAAMFLKESKHGKFFGCSMFPECKGTHGAHPDGKPFGEPANAATKLARMHAHAAFDQLWKDRLQSNDGKPARTRTRNEAYLWLANQLDIKRRDCHIGLFDSNTCAAVVRVCEAYTGRVVLPPKPKEKNMDEEPVSFDDVKVKHETDRALLCVIDGTDIWVPKSQITDESEVFDNEDHNEGVLIVKHWWADKNGLA